MGYLQASLIVKVYRYEEHSFKIVSFWLYRNIEDPDIFVPRAFYSEKGRDVTRNSLGRWDENHMPPRTFSSMAYVSQAVTVVTLKQVIQKVEQPAGQHSQYQDNYRRAYIIRLLLDAWSRTEPS